MTKLIILISSLLIINVYSPQKQVSIFRFSGYYKSFYLRLDDKYVYNEKNKRLGNGAYGFPITKYATSKQSIEVYLKIDDRDTLFNYDLEKCKCDSLIMGDGDNNSFVILNEKEYPWVSD